MRSVYPLIIFIILVSTSALFGYRSFRQTQSCVQTELNQALNRTLTQRRGQIACTDTIRTCRRLSLHTGSIPVVSLKDHLLSQSLAIKELRDRVVMTCSLASSPRLETVEWQHYGWVVASDTFYIHADDGTLFSFRSYASLTLTDIWSLSDFRPSVALLFLSLLWWVFFYSRNRSLQVLASSDPLSTSAETVVAGWGDIIYEANSRRFYAADGTPVPFTPMQETLMEMFYRAEGHCLTQQEICQTLWPKKQNATESLYTLIRRLKQVLHDHSTLSLINDRGHGYVINIENQESQENVRQESDVN